jgi:hypothetical protein
LTAHDAGRSKRLNDLCRSIAEEKNPVKFTALVEKLNSLLERQERKLEANAKPKEWRNCV